MSIDISETGLEKIIVGWLVKEDKRAIELDNENTNVKPIPGSWNTVFNRDVEQLFIIPV